MCTTCGCSDDAHLTVTRMTPLDAAVDHGPHRHHPRSTQTLTLERKVLDQNDLLARRNREQLSASNILALNLVSSPGSGKTRLLETTLTELGRELACTVLEGDQHTLADARRIRASGCPVVQLNTGTGCHLEADMIQQGIAELAPAADSVLFIENVGNLVCPALFDLGEHAKVVLLSVTEGDDKPLKYPHMFRAAELMIINKSDLLPYVEFDVERCMDAARQVNPAIECLVVSATTGEGMSAWYDWLRQRRTTLNLAHAS